MPKSEVTVYIWEYKGVHHFGHAALRLEGIPGKDPKRKVYISWWPGDNREYLTWLERNAHDSKLAQKIIRRHFGGLTPYSTGAERVRTALHDRLVEMSDETRKNLAEKKFEPRDGQREKVVGVVRGAANPPFPNGKVYEEWGVDDFKDFQAVGAYPRADEGLVKVWVQEPVKIRIPMLGTPGGPFGLDGVQIFRWWKVFRASPTNRYRLISKTQNCAGVIALALQAGLGENYAKKPTPRLFMEPNHIRKWAEDIQREVALLNHGVARFLTQPTGSSSNKGLKEVMSQVQWQAKIKGCRCKYLDRIGPLLAQYEAYGEWTIFTFDPRVGFLGKIMDLIHKHLVHHPADRRNAAALELGEQIVQTIRYQATQTGIAEPDWISRP
jgi:hypothetical protein